MVKVCGEMLVLPISGMYVNSSQLPGPHNIDDIGDCLVLNFMLLFRTFSECYWKCPAVTTTADADIV